MKKVLLLDTNLSSAPIYQYLLKSGYDVIVVGSNPNDTLAKCVDQYINLDYSNLSAVKELISDRNIDHVVPGCNDRSYIVAAEINDSLSRCFTGIDTLASSKLINSKNEFRSCAAGLGLSVPTVFSNDDPGNLKYPVIVKPIDSFSGRGVTVLHDQAQFKLSQAIESAKAVSLTNEYLVEAYVQGQLFSHSAFVHDGKIIEDFIVEEHGTANPFVVDTSWFVSEFNHFLIDKIRNEIEDLVKELQLVDGLIHTQFIINNNDYWIIEITRRCPGDLYSQLIELSSGFNYIENYVNPFIGLDFNFIKEPYERRKIIRHTISQSSSGHLGSLDFSKPLNVVKWFALAKAGDEMKPSPYGRAAIVFIESKSLEEHRILAKSFLTRTIYSNTKIA